MASIKFWKKLMIGRGLAVVVDVGLEVVVVGLAVVVDVVDVVTKAPGLAIQSK